ncbi:DCC1-like thiol-disulfide oxidoreductase family protein [Sphingobacterium sp. UT-1RO-CII-1]|uniref:thiol-disulfide oxidoreductase DCC family protein n=1 Tax=Sphingobacterium sp. UT-1RO-CII-1 TaxID=2995225 RepID=UPI00227C83D8|nr:DCC1-like thiol-disulfide oxidoreductase family protein [Sphingobacterium sp. UT-1RO-CII-1]MCY4779823.1 DCC1-like thiol-disulfide oxidoreductase family protein [Sphingobacterium sp. UT-1RO-CII-1]
METPQEIKSLLNSSDIELIVLFDGVCNLCNSTVDFIIKNDKNKNLRYASLQSELGSRVLAYFKTRPDSIILVSPNYLYTKADAALLIAKELKKPYSLLYYLRVVPLKIRNLIYDVIAKNRYKWFGKKNSCRLPNKEEQKLFIEKL